MLVMAAAVNAQITTSSMAGQVSDDQGEDVIGATIRVTHVPSGTTYNAVTNSDGRWAIQGMRVGGPYTVKVTYIGYAEKTIEGVSLQLGETYNLNVKMSEDVNELGEVVVVGNGSKFSAEKTGATTNISNAQITALAEVRVSNAVAVHVLVCVVNIRRTLEGVGTRFCYGIDTSADEIGLANVERGDNHLHFVDSLH